jgi:predicted lipid-binding transport protein (Tim44 family)
MSEGFQYLDILFLAFIAGFLVLRLRGVLGRRDGHDQGYHDPFTGKDDTVPGDDNVVAMNDVARADADRDAAADASADAPAPDDVLGNGLVSVARALRGFDPDEFVVGARVAFDMILSAYTQGDTAALKNLLGTEVYGNFSVAIRDREKSGEVLEDTLVGIKEAEIVEAFTEGKFANVTIKFVSQQVNARRDENGEVIDGNPNLVIDVTDFWTFTRDTYSKDPNWTLAATGSLD